MRDYAAALEASRKLIIEKRLMSSPVCDAFIKNIMLVLIGVRDSYMFETFSCSESVAVELVSKLRRIFCVPERCVVTLFPSGDVIVTLETILCSKLDHREGWPIVVDVSDRAPTLWSNTKCKVIIEVVVFMLRDMIQTVQELDGVLILRIPEDCPVGPVLLAGWILGYPFLYNFTPINTTEVGCRALSMQLLKKMSLSADFEALFKGHAFMEFTVPSDLIVYPVQINGIQCDSLVEILVNKIRMITCRLHSRGGMGCDISIRYNITECQIPHVMI